MQLIDWNDNFERNYFNIKFFLSKKKVVIFSKKKITYKEFPINNDDEILENCIFFPTKNMCKTCYFFHVETIQWAPANSVCMALNAPENRAHSIHNSIKSISHAYSHKTQIRLSVPKSVVAYANLYAQKKKYWIRNPFTVMCLFNSNARLR